MARVRLNLLRSNLLGALIFSCVRSNKWVGLEGLDNRTEGSLVPETLTVMDQDEDFAITGAVRYV